MSKLWPHQESAVRRVKEEIWPRFGGAMLAMSMGTGKTRVSIDLLRSVNAHKALVLCPQTVCRVWEQQVERHATGEWSVLALDSGTTEKRAKILKDAKGPIIATVNYEASIRPAMSRALRSTNWDVVICDESHRIKAPGGKASRLAHKFSPRQEIDGWSDAPYRLALTGTPMPHTPMDLYAQMRFVAPQIFGTSMARFRQRWGRWGGFEGHKLIEIRDPDKLNRMWREATIEVGADVLGLPSSVHVDHPVMLEKSALKIYKQAQDGIIEDLSDDSILASNILVRLLWLQQITGGHWRNSETKGIHEVSTAKKEVFSDIVKDLPPNEPIVVFTRFSSDLVQVEDVVKGLKGKNAYLELSGNRNDLEEWQNGQGQVLGVQIQAGAVGIDLTRSSHAVYWTTGLSAGDYHQSLARLNRPGQTKQVVYHHLHAGKTIDQWVRDTLAKRKALVDAVLESGIRNILSGN